LHEASWKGHPEVVQLLLDSGADMEIKGNYGSNALHLASSHGKAEVRTVEICTIHHTSYIIHHTSYIIPIILKYLLKVVQLLLDRGANKEAKDDKGRTSLTLAKKKSVREVFKRHKQVGVICHVIELHKIRLFIYIPHAKDQIWTFNLCWVYIYADWSFC
jgi:ankyrin repeat protein